jgi:demethylmenaquinone methyltransferase/2-methoxy-6-polyprenyl-1,4-benzoquinol methylase
VSDADESRSDAGGVTDFGFEQVPVEEKSERVASVFSSVAGRYDLMNDLMSFGIHRLWKRFTVAAAGVREGQHVLDLAGGTGDLARLFARRVGPRGSVTLADVNPAMLDLGRRRMVDAGILGGVDYVQLDAESLPFSDESFHAVSMAFGLRNVTHKSRALESILRVLKPGGQALILEFSKLTVPMLDPLYRAYTLKVLPRLGEVVAGDGASYRYLAESIRMHPTQRELLEMMGSAGFEQCRYHNLSAGVVALHRGFKL